MPRPKPANQWIDKAHEWIGDRLPVNVDEANIWVLRHKTQLLRETTDAPWHKRAPVVADFAADVATAPLYANVGFDIQKVFVHLQVGQSRLRCSIAAIGAERYRLRHGHWPDSLAALAPEFAPVVAADPFDGEPLRYRRLPDGVVIYTVGPDLTDNGGNLSAAIPPADGTDIGFRLWDVPKRGQAPNR